MSSLAVGMDQEIQQCCWDGGWGSVYCRDLWKEEVHVISICFCVSQCGLLSLLIQRLRKWKTGTATVASAAHPHSNQHLWLPLLLGCRNELQLPSCRISCKRSLWGGALSLLWTDAESYLARSTVFKRMKCCVLVTFNNSNLLRKNVLPGWMTCRCAVVSWLGIEGLSSHRRFCPAT